MFLGLMFNQLSNDFIVLHCQSQNVVETFFMVGLTEYYLSPLDTAFLDSQK